MRIVIVKTAQNHREHGIARVVTKVRIRHFLDSKPNRALHLLSLVILTATRFLEKLVRKKGKTGRPQPVLTLQSRREEGSTTSKARVRERERGHGKEE